MTVNLSTCVLPVKLFEDMSPCAENRNLIVAFPDETCVLQVLSLVSHVLTITSRVCQDSYLLAFVFCVSYPGESHVVSLLANRSNCVGVDRVQNVWIEFRTIGCRMK